MPLTGRRVELRPVEPDDAPFLRDLIGGWEGLRCYHAVPWVPSLDDVRSHHNDMRSFLVVERATGERAGLVRLVEHDLLHGRAEIALYLRPESRGQTLGLEAGVLLLHYGFRYLNLARVDFRPFATNLASRALCEGLGFHCDGVLRSFLQHGDRRVDVVVYSLLDEEYWGSELWSRLRHDHLEDGPGDRAKAGDSPEDGGGP